MQSLLILAIFKESAPNLLFFLHYILIRGLFNKATELWSPHLAEFEETWRKRLDREAGGCLCWGETQWECACRRSPAAPSVPRAVADQKQMSTVIWGSSTGSSSLLHHCGVESRTHLFLAIYYNVHSRTSNSQSDCRTWCVKVFPSSSSDLWPLEHKDEGAFCFVPRRVFKEKKNRFILTGGLLNVAGPPESLW